MTLTQSLINQLNENHVSIDEFVYLWASANALPWEVKLDVSSLRKLESLGLLRAYEVTELGLSLINSLSQENIKPNDFSSDFERFWKTFPSSDGHSVFPPTRRFKTGKAQTLAEYNKLRSTGVTPETLLAALEADIEYRKRNSITKNELKFLKSPSRWLEDKCYLDHDTNAEGPRITKIRVG